MNAEGTWEHGIDRKKRIGKGLKEKRVLNAYCYDSLLTSFGLCLIKVLLKISNEGVILGLEI